MKARSLYGLLAGTLLAMGLTGVAAAAIGLVNHVVPDDEVLEQAMACAQKIAALPQQAVEDTKRILNLHLQRAVTATIDFALSAEHQSDGAS